MGLALLDLNWRMVLGFHPLKHRVRFDLNLKYDSDFDFSTWFIVISILKFEITIIKKKVVEYILFPKGLINQLDDGALR